ncbi:MAG: oxaloacetate decarboxylase [Rhodospirillales bacterium]|nr:oxaloacetate decarboxylase [Rhodospirillales bacterium]
MTNVRKALREIIAAPGLVPIAGCYDVLSAKMAERAGFAVVHVGGYNLSACHLGLPDVGYLTLAENVAYTQRIASVLKVPLIADGDDGYGNYLNVGRLIVEMERAGVAGIHVEDQVLPKRCGHMAGKRVVPKGDMVQKLKAAVDARRDEDFVIIARTDAIAVTGIDDAIDRARAYKEAGADVLFVEAPVDEAQFERVVKEVPGPLLYNWVFKGKSPMLPAARIRELGYKFVLCTDVLLAVARTLEEFFAEMKSDGTCAAFGDRMMAFDDFNTFIGLDAVAALDRRYGGA